MTRVLAAHGTRDPAGQATLAALTAAVAERIGPVRVGWLDVLTPTLAEVVADRTSGVIVPLLLSEGYHLSNDIPAAVDGSSWVVTPALGDDDRLVEALAGRLAEAGWSGEPVVLAGTGSARDSWHVLAGRVANRLGERLGVPAELGVLSGPGRPLAEAVETLRRRSRGNVAVSAYLLAEGHFHRRLGEFSDSLVSAPIGAHPRLVDLVVERFRTAC